MRTNGRLLTVPSVPMPPNIVEPLQKMPWGLRQFTVEDLDGNRFYFHHD